MKTAVLTFSLIICYFISFGQNFHGGPIIGFTATQVDGDTYSGYNKAGVIVGGFVNKKLSDVWSAQLEIKYIQKGSKKEPNNSDPTYYKLKLDYFEVPFIVQYLYKKKLTFETGLAAAYLANAKEDNDGYGLIEANPPFNKVEISALAGANYNITKRLIFNIRASYSMHQIRNHTMRNNLWLRYGQFNNVISFSVYYFL